MKTNNLARKLNKKYRRPNFFIYHLLPIDRWVNESDYMSWYKNGNPKILSFILPLIFKPNIHWIMTFNVQSQTFHKNLNEWYLKGGCYIGICSYGYQIYHIFVNSNLAWSTHQTCLFLNKSSFISTNIWSGFMIFVDLIIVICKPALFKFVPLHSVDPWDP